MSRKVWPLGLAAREGIETAKSGRWTSLIVVFAVAWIIAAPGAADAIGVTSLVTAEQEWIDAGGHVFVVTGARDEGTANPVPAGVCERLAAVDGVDGAFALRRTTASGTLSYIPGGRTSIYEVSPGAAEFLRLDPSASGIVIATAGFADRTGARDGDTVAVSRRATTEDVATTSEPLTLRVAGSSVLGEEYDGALLIPTLIEGTADVCFVRTDAAHHSAVEGALATMLAYDGAPAIAASRLFESEFTVDYTHAYEGRALRWVWVPAAALLGLVWAMLQWFRRSHIAIYATFGMRAPSRLIMQVSEWGVLASFGALWGWSIGVVGALALGARVEQALTLVSFHALLTLIGASALVVLLGLRPTGTLLNALKDR